MSEPYLIAHVVRGEPSFDIAIKLQIGSEEGWIIPTSGHRAYPYWAKALIDYIPNGVFQAGIEELPVTSYAHYNNYLYPVSPPGWPDHYSTLPAPKGQGLLSNLAEALGFAPKPIKIRRR